MRRVPPEIQDGAPNGYYYPAAIDGTRPAIYWINLKDTGDWPKYQQPSLTYHEGVPGHHLQNGCARLGGDLPKLLQNYFISAYGEGWALYSEQLADELGGYSGIERAGYLQSFLFRATPARGRHRPQPQALEPGAGDPLYGGHHRLHAGPQPA